MATGIAVAHSDDAGRPIQREDDLVASSGDWAALGIYDGYIDYCEVLAVRSNR